MVKVTVNLPEQVVEALEQMARDENVTKTEALRRAISTEKYLRDAQGEGSKVLIEEKDGTVERIVFR